MLYANLDNEELVLSHPPPALPHKGGGEGASPSPLWGGARGGDSCIRRIMYAMATSAEQAFTNGTLPPLTVISLIQEGTHFVPLPE